MPKGASGSESPKPNKPLLTPEQSKAWEEAENWAPTDAEIEAARRRTAERRAANAKMRDQGKA